MWNKEQINAFISGFLSVFISSIVNENYSRKRQDNIKSSKVSKFDKSLSRYFFRSQNYVRSANEAIRRDKGYIKDERDTKIF